MTGPNPSGLWFGRGDVTVVRGAKDEITGDWSSDSSEHVLPGCLIAPAGSQEQSDRSEFGDQVTTRRDIYTAPGADVLSTDRLRLPGETGAPLWQVVGDPDSWGPGTVVRAERVSG